MDKAGGKGERQLVGEAKQTQRETYYSHTLITMYSPTLTGTRLGHNTHTPETYHWPKGGLISANRRSAEIH